MPIYITTEIQSRNKNSNITRLFVGSMLYLGQRRQEFTNIKTTIHVGLSTSWCINWVCARHPAILANGQETNLCGIMDGSE